MHTLVRLLNPFNAQYSIQGIFHPSYRAVHQEAAALLKQPHMAVLKGEGGETERNPDMDCLVQSVHEGELSLMKLGRHFLPSGMSDQKA